MSGGLDYFAHRDTRGQARPRGKTKRQVDPDGLPHRSAVASGRSSSWSAQHEGRSCCSLHYNAPHWPWGRATMGRSRSASTEHLPPRRRLDVTYLAMIHQMDEGIGQMLAALERRGWPTIRWWCSRATTAANASPTTGRWSAGRWICSKAESACPNRALAARLPRGRTTAFCSRNSLSAKRDLLGLFSLLEEIDAVQRIVRVRCRPRRHSRNVAVQSIVIASRAVVSAPRQARGPARDIRHADASLQQVHLAADQRPVVGEALAAVVARENHQRALGSAGALVARRAPARCPRPYGGSWAR